jgi:hypothetical protein
MIGSLYFFRMDSYNSKGTIFLSAISIPLYSLYKHQFIQKEEKKDKKKSISHIIINSIIVIRLFLFSKLYFFL